MERKRQTGVQWKIFLYLIGFSALLLLVLWLFQIVLLESFFKEIKVKEIDKEANRIVELLNNTQDVLNDQEQMAEFIIEIDTISRLGSLYVDIWETEEYTFNSILPFIIVRSRGIQESMTVLEKYQIYERTLAKGGKDRWEIPSIDQRDGKNTNIDVFLYTEICKLSPSGKEVLVTVSTNITPLESTVRTLTVQLQYVTMIMVILSSIIAIFISKYVSTPIEDINESAKELGKGNYDIEFSGRGYKEVSELSDTLNQAAKELSKVDTLQKELIANVSHDLRTPLTMISGYTEMMRDIPNENTPENIQIVIDETQRLTSLVNDLLDMSRAQASKDELNLEVFSLTDTIKRVLKRFTTFTQKEKYEIIFDYDERVDVKADESRVLQVIYNLLTNALTYTGKDKKIIVKQSVQDDKVKIEVIDSGIGIKKEEIGFVWKKYYQVGDNHKRAVTGTGLGLTIVKENLEKHGDIGFGVESEEGKGANFWFEIPIFKEEN